MTDILKLTEELVEDQDLSEEDIQLILEAVRQRDKERPLTQKEMSEILDIVHKKTQIAKYDKTPKRAKIMGWVLAVVGLINIISIIVAGYHVLTSGQAGAVLKSLTTTSTIVVIATIVVGIAIIVLSSFVGVRLIRGQKGRAGVLIHSVLILTALQTIGEVMLYGIRFELLDNLVLAIVCIITSTLLNPSIKTESELRAGLRKLDIEIHAKHGTLGLADPGEGFIRLDFYNVFWTFVVCCVLGLVVEIIFHMVVVDPGHYEDRAGLLFGPFSPIYGFGAVFMTIALNRFKDKNIILIFVVCTIIGGAFEYSVSWFMEVAFGAVAWDYHGKFLGDFFGGRTCLLYASMFGVLGLAWIKLLLPLLLKLINKIPPKMRYGVTGVCATLMLINCCMTVQALDNWSSRLSGHTPQTPIEQFYADYFGDDVMSHRFQSMSLSHEHSAKK